MDVSGYACEHCRHSYQTTKKDKQLDGPLGWISPDLWNAATNCGRSVIWIRLAMMDPRAPPPRATAAIWANTSLQGAIWPRVAAIPPVTPICNTLLACALFYINHLQFPSYSPIGRSPGCLIPPRPPRNTKRRPSKLLDGLRQGLTLQRIRSLLKTLQLGSRKGYCSLEDLQAWKRGIVVISDIKKLFASCFLVFAVLSSFRTIIWRCPCFSFK